MPTQRSVRSYFALPAVAAVCAVGAAAFYGGITLAIVVGLLIILEISLSLDNAVVNAAVLKNWDPGWRKAFLGVGIIVAVFGMRLLFPLLVVSVTTHLSMPLVANLALHRPTEYAQHLHDVHYLVAAFGGAFLLMVGLEFFIDSEKDNHWIGPIENMLTKLGQIQAIQAALSLIAIHVTAHFLAPELRNGFNTAGSMGVITYVFTKTFGSFATGGGEVADKVIRGSIGGFLYLELLDASFSFDGVIGAFAITQNLIWITVGLGVGALTVRELTLLAVDRGTLTEFPYLEHGAFWAILALAGIMIVSPVFPIPEYVTGLTGAVLILAAFVTSLVANKRAVVAVSAA